VRVTPPFGREPFDELRVSSRVEKLRAERLRTVSLSNGRWAFFSSLLRPREMKG